MNRFRALSVISALTSVLPLAWPPPRVLVPAEAAVDPAVRVFLADPGAACRFAS